MNIPINGFKLDKSKYSDIRIVSCRPPKTGEKATVVIEFITKKIIYAKDEQELIEQIEDALEE